MGVEIPTQLNRIQRDLVRRLKLFAVGQPQDFRDICIDLSDQTPFQRAILTRCREIPHGSTMTYGQLAAAAGYPRSARAVGNVMASNRTPMVIPCHRVLAAGQRVGGFSAPGGIAMKRKMLQLEQRYDPTTVRGKMTSATALAAGRSAQ